MINGILNEGERRTKLSCQASSLEPEWVIFFFFLNQIGTIRKEPALKSERC